MDRPTPSVLPETPGIYLYKDAEGHIIYVGKARNLRRRILSYFRPVSALTPKTAAMIGRAATLETLSTGTEKEALLLEASLIKKHRPHYNIVLRDDKQYVMFRIGRESPYPRLEIVRQQRKDGARYFGPFTSAAAARETWKSIHKAFPLRRCTDRAFKNRQRPCLYHHIGQCLAPCTEMVDQNRYADIVQRVEMLLAGRSRELLDQLHKRMLSASENLEFERAAEFRDQINAIRRTVERQSVVLPDGGDMDIVGVTPVQGGLGLGLLFVREGRLVDGKTFFWPNLAFVEAPELLQSFLGQFYGPLAAIPPRIVVPWLLDDPEGARGATDTNDTKSFFCNPENTPPLAEVAEHTAGYAAPEIMADGNDGEETEAFSLAALEAALGETRGGPVRIALPRNAGEASLVDMAVSNAIEAALSRTETSIAGLLGRAFFHTARNDTEEKEIRRIECVDVSHTGGSSTRVGMVVFEDGQPDKPSYRTYTLEGEHACNGDDYAALAEWARRRLESGPPWADLVLIDGGRGQISAVHRVLLDAGVQTGCEPNARFVLAGIAKARNEMGRADRRAGNVSDRIFLPGRSNPLPLREGSPELLFLQHVRDTAHHFVIGRHRHARAAAALSGELMRIPGIGPGTARLLWDHFETLEAMTSATEEDLCTLPGIGPRKARQLAERLHQLGSRNSPTVQK